MQAQCSQQKIRNNLEITQNMKKESLVVRGATSKNIVVYCEVRNR